MTTKARTMMSAAPRSLERSPLTNQSMLPDLQIEVAIVNPDSLRRFRWVQLALRSFAGRRNRVDDALPLQLKPADRSLSIPPATAIFEVRQLGAEIENVAVGSGVGGVGLLNQGPACRVNDSD